MPMFTTHKKKKQKIWAKYHVLFVFLAEPLSKPVERTLYAWHSRVTFVVPTVHMFGDSHEMQILQNRLWKFTIEQSHGANVM